LLKEEQKLTLKKQLGFGRKQTKMLFMFEMNRKKRKKKKNWQLPIKKSGRLTQHVGKQR
jgi:hypothetical protein